MVIKREGEKRREGSVFIGPWATVFTRVVAQTCIEVEARLAFLFSINAQATFSSQKKSEIRSEAAASMGKRKMKNFGREDKSRRSVKLHRGLRRQVRPRAKIASQKP